MSVVIAMTLGLLSNSAPSIAQSENWLLDEAKKLNIEIATLYKVGRYADAIPLARRALELREKALSPDHPDVAWSLNTSCSSL
jgi:hypothetical protein